MPDLRRIAVIDSETNIRASLERNLVEAGFAVRTAVDGADGLALVRSWNPDCIVLDAVMPRIDGLSLIPLVRKVTDVPIIMFTPRGNVRDRIDGLRAGADDCLAKPFEIEEVAARIESALRRPTLLHLRRLRVADLEIDFDARSVARGERHLRLSTREFDLLAVLARRPKRVFTREELIDLAWGDDRDIAPATVETYISYLRGKVDQGSESRLIHTVRGIGYVLREG